MTVETASVDATGGIPVALGDSAGSLVESPGQLQYGPMLLGGGTSAGWRSLVGWRNLAGAEIADAPRPQAHGVYPGDIYSGALAVTYEAMVRGAPDAKLRALDTIERYTRMDGVERPLVVEDGSGRWMRMGRIIGRVVPIERHFEHGPVRVSLQWSCADPRRYAVEPVSVKLTLPTSSGGLEYPLTYPLEYGTFSVGSAVARNMGSESTPLVATFRGPLTSPVLTASEWSLGFDLTLAAGEYLTVDTYEGTARLNGNADRLYTITSASDPVELCLLPPGATDVALTATSGTGTLDLTYRHARM